ncbi:MAG TPA: phosphotriesterase-related protein [Dehalococcoidia bacterium]|nr:phosphotriesterase-related protein [Dehalococcoidia bacterium]
MPTVETVLGPIDAVDLGFTLSHEHVLVAMGEDNHHYPWLFDWEGTRENAVRELTEAKAGGVDTIIDLTTPDLGRDVEFVRDVARAAGINIVVATGIWRDVPRSFWERPLDRIADIFVREIEVGIGETGIKAGVIKVANDAEGVTPEAERVLRGAARALKRTSCPISTHHWAPKEVGRRQVEIFRDEGAQMERICIGHSADTTDVPYLESLLETGVYLSMDRYPGAEDRPDWRQRNATVKALIDRGWAHRLMLGHDYAPAPVSARHRGEATIADTTRYLFLSTVALPALKQGGVSSETIDLMMREVPRRFLTGAGGGA